MRIVTQCDENKFSSQKNGMRKKAYFQPYKQGFDLQSILHPYFSGIYPDIS